MTEADRETQDEKPVEAEEKEAYEEFLLEDRDQAEDTCEEVPVLSRALLRKLSMQG